MLDERPQGSARAAWFAVAAWTAFLYVGIFFGRAIQQAVYKQAGRNVFIVIVGAALLVAVTVAVRTLRRHGREIRPAQWLWLGVVATVFAAGTWHLRRAPEEALHFVEYGVLGFLLFRALAHHLADPLIFVAAGLLGALVGTFDEILQWALPSRNFDFRDIVNNAAAGLLVQAALAQGLRPSWIRRPCAPASWVVAGRLFAAQSLVLLLCFSNTLERQIAYLQRLPLPPAWRYLNDLMVEYGYLHRDPDRLSFYSRLPREEILRQDRARAAEAAARLDAWQGTNGYHRFNMTMNGVMDPYLYELRVRLFRRDKHAGHAVQLRRDPAKARYSATIAWREQALLDRYNSNTVAASSYALPDARRALLAQLADRTSPYTSAVSSQLFVRFREGHAQAGLGACILAGLAVTAYHRRKRGAPP